MTEQTETMILSDADLDSVVGGLNPQPLPPGPPPPDLHRSFASILRNFEVVP